MNIYRKENGKSFNYLDNTYIKCSLKRSRACVLPYKLYCSTVPETRYVRVLNLFMQCIFNGLLLQG